MHASSPRRRPSPWLLVVSVYGVGVAVTACAGGSTAPKSLARTTGHDDAGAADSDASATRSGGLGLNPTSSGPSAPLPNVRTPPQITVVSSKRSSIVPRAEAAACVRTTAVGGEGPAREVDKLAKACGAATRMKASGATVSGAQSASKPSLEVPFEAQAGRCYRVAFASAASVNSLSVVMRDSDGAVAAEEISNARLGAVPHDGAVCFTAKDRAVIVASVGDGDGAFALQVLEGDKL